MACIRAVLLVLLCASASALLRPSVATRRASPFMATGKDSSEPEKSKNAFMDLLKKVVTGSPDGVMQLGKPQFDWSTGKPMKKPRQFDWNAGSKPKSRSSNQ
eukprot:CAMPEP_0184391028 /NCGR_PEP_ID=MMETSP0007-20130409/13780_1 /TAXON_ID=97485 /ORGANISM="Prymnesium parvum, Strain Texoma1" /LENGTH=101 /DNA_ID=CAMNT_0026740999 /DNA_START=166 /DNA_END=471 /DNA_ORIENTATION=+